MTWPQEAVQERLPVRVRGIECNDPFLTIFGEEWSLNLGCPWEGNIGSISISWEDDDVEDRAWELVGLDLTSVVDGSGGGPEFHFSDAMVHVRPDTDLDPWVLHLAGLIVVGTMT